MAKRSLMTIEELKHKLAKLKEDHSALDENMQALMAHVPYDQLAVQRMKKRKLLIKDEILRVQTKLHPDIIA